MSSTLPELQARRAAYMAAELKILQSQEYQVGQGSGARRNRRADLESIQSAIRDLDAQIDRATAAAGGHRRVYHITPR